MTEKKKADIDKEIDQILNAADPNQAEKDTAPAANQDRSVIQTGDIKGEYVQVGGQMIIDRRKTIYVERTRRAKDPIDSDQQKAIKRKIEAIVELDALMPGAEGDNHHECTTIARRKRWQALQREFHVSSYKHITRSQFKAAMAWLEDQHDIELDKIDPSRTGHTGSAKTLVLVLLFATALAAWPFIETLLPDPPQARAATSYYKVPAADPGRPVITPAAATENDYPEKGFNILFFTGCAHIKHRPNGANIALKTI